MKVIIVQLSLQVFKYLAGFDIVVHEMLGQSENCGLLTANIPKRLTPTPDNSGALKGEGSLYNWSPV